MTSQRAAYFGVFLLALAVRALYLFELRDDALFAVLLGDGRQYDLWARRIAAGDWFGDEVFYQAPLYPYFLATVYGVFAKSVMAVRFVQIVLGSASCLLLALAGRRFFDRRTGLLAGALLALYPPAIYFDGLIQKPALAGSLVVLLLWLLAEFQTRSDGRWALGAGVALGALALTRENALALIPVVVLWIIVAFPDAAPGRRARWTAALLGGALLVLVPVGLRNQAIGGRFQLTTAQFGTNLYIGNHAAANGRSVPLRPGRESARYERRDAEDLAEAALGRELKPGEVSDYWRDRSLEWMRAHPGDWLALMGYKTWLVWQASEVMDTESIEAYRERSVLLRVPGSLFHFGVLAPIALLGVWITRDEWRRLSLLYAFLLVTTATLAAFFVLARYRHPLVPVLCLFAAAALLGLPELVRRSSPRTKTAAVAIVVVSALALNLPVRGGLDPRTITFYSVGSALIERGDLDRARAALERAVEIEPGFADARFKLGDLALRSGDSVTAGEHFTEALRLDGRHADAHTGLGMLRMRGGLMQEAAASFGAALAIDAEHGAALNNLAALRASEGRLGEAHALLERAVVARPDEVDARVNLGKILLALGQPLAARDRFAEALELDAGHAGARDGLTRAERSIPPLATPPPRPL